MPTDTQICCHGCNYCNNNFCRLFHQDVEQQDCCNCWRGKEIVFKSEDKTNG